jgi:hypothetical protein
VPCLGLGKKNSVFCGKAEWCKIGALFAKAKRRVGLLPRWGKINTENSTRDFLPQSAGRLGKPLAACFVKWSYPFSTFCGASHE